MSEIISKYRVFFATPGGLTKEREAFKNVINDYNESDAIHRGVYFEPVGWEFVLEGMGRPQFLINEELQKCDYFILLLWDRWGSPTASDGELMYSSGCEEELEVAKKCISDSTKPMRQIVIFFKSVDPRQLSDPGLQLKKVLDFKTKLEEEKKYLFGTFDELNSYKQKLRCQLANWLRCHEQGFKTNMLELDFIQKADVSVPKPSNLRGDSSSLLDKAEGLAKEGKLTDAEAIFAEAAINGDNPLAFIRYGRFLQRIGLLSRAEIMYRHVLELAQHKKSARLQATAYGNLGLIYQTRGDLKIAKKMHKEALKINENTGHKKGLAIAFTNLGLIYQSYGDYKQAEEMHRKVLKINEDLNLEVGKAIALSNLGNVYQCRKDLIRAEELFREALKINKQVGREECVAKDYGRLGEVLLLQDNLTDAKDMVEDALKINKRLGRQKGIADSYSNLGKIYQKTNDVKSAEEMHTKALVINEIIGRRESIAENYMNLGLIKRERKQFRDAEELLNKSNKIYLSIGEDHMAKKVQIMLKQS